MGGSVRALVKNQEFKAKKTSSAKKRKRASAQGIEIGRTMEETSRRTKGRIGQDHSRQQARRRSTRIVEKASVHAKNGGLNNFGNDWSDDGMKRYLCSLKNGFAWIATNHECTGGLDCTSINFIECYTQISGRIKRLSSTKYE